MIDLGLDATAQAAYNRALVIDHPIRIKVTVLDQNEKPESSLTAPVNWIESGSVTIDTTTAVKRQLELVLIDPNRELQVHPRSPARLAVGPEQFLAVEYGVFVAELNTWIDCPVFWGPLVAATREGEEVTLRGLSKEMLGLDPFLAWSEGARTFRTGAKKVDVIEQLMRGQGERRFALPASDAKLKDELSVTRKSEPWRHAQKIAASMDRQLFYDGLGRLRLRPFPTHAVYEFRRGVNIAGNPEITDELVEGVRNLAEVIGGPPSKNKTAVRAVAMAPGHHRLSPWSLARNGEPRWMVVREENSEINTRAEAAKRAETLLRQGLHLYRNVQLQALTNPQLEERDIVRVVDGDLVIEFEVKELVIPLSGDTMTVGSRYTPFQGEGQAEVFGGVAKGKAKGKGAKKGKRGKKAKKGKKGKGKGKFAPKGKKGKKGKFGPKGGGKKGKKGKKGKFVKAGPKGGGKGGAKGGGAPKGKKGKKGK